MVQEHMDPFYNECRAYGKLIETKRNGEYAVECYGYLHLPASIETEMTSRFRVTEWDRPSSEASKPMSLREPFRCIVKELIEEDTPFTRSQIKSMLTHLRRIRQIGIFPMDIAARNYRGGTLIDFSAAMTRPHYLFAIKPLRWVARDMWQDLADFDEMIQESGFPTQIKACPNTSTLKKLRNPPPVEDIFKIVQRG